MKGELMVSDLSISMDEDTGRKYLYGALFDFYADTEEGLEKLTGAMLEKELFSFCNNGSYIGVDSRTKMHWTLDDGNPSMDWLVDVAGVVKELNNQGDNVTISISKKFLLTTDAVKDMTLKNMDDTKIQEKLIDLYVHYLKEVMEGAGYGDLLRTQVKGKLFKSIPSELEDGMIYLEI